MAETHLLQHVAALVLAMWWNKQWLITRPVSRWRFAVSALAGAILWIYVAFTATGSQGYTDGSLETFTSMPLAYFAVFMSFMSVMGILIGLLLWTEEETKRASENLPAAVQSNLSESD